MNRWQRAALAIVLGLAMVGVGQADDEIYHKTKDKEGKEVDARAKGKIEEESPAGIKIRLKNKNKDLLFIPAKDIAQVVYDCSNVDAVTFRAPDGKRNQAKIATGKKRAELLNTALKGYTEMEPKLAGEPNAKRYVKFRIAQVAVMQAQTDPVQVETAIKLLTEFKKDHSNGWETRGP